VISVSDVLKKVENYPVFCDLAQLKSMEMFEKTFDKILLFLETLKKQVYRSKIGSSLLIIAIKMNFSVRQKGIDQSIPGKSFQTYCPKLLKG